MTKHILYSSLFGSLLFWSPVAQSQSQPQPAPTEVPQVQKKVAANQPVPGPRPQPLIDPHETIERNMVANVVVERQVALRQDTDKLLSLAAELKQNVDKTSPSILSLDVVKKAQEIEKLAKSVKDKMKDAY
jgi:hypothetical protein